MALSKTSGSIGARTAECPVCMRSDFQLLDERDKVPVLQNVIVRTRQQALDFPTGRLRMCGCNHCGFVWNADFDAAAIDYGADYNNSVQASAVYLAHQNAMAANIRRDISELNYLEIGCGAGEFIEVLDRTGALASAIGFDPAWTNARRFGPHVTIRAEYFNRLTAKKVPKDINLVCSRHTIEHIPDPRGFIGEIASFVADRDVPLFLETPDVTWILERAAFEDFFYEHCSLFSPASMQYLLAEFGLEAQTKQVYGGQYMWTEAKALDRVGAQRPDTSLFAGYRVRLAEAKSRWRTRIEEIGRSGSVAIWGAASKGVTFALMMQGIDFAIDLNSAKQGGYLPVTATPIVSPQEAMAAGVTAVIVMNPNYEDEIRRYVSELNWQPEILSLHAN